MNPQLLKPKFDQVMVVAKQTYTTAKVKLAAFWNERKRFILWTTAIALLAVVVTALFVYLWRHSPLFRATVLIAVAGLALGLSDILEWLKSHIPQGQPVAVTIEPAPAFVGQPAAGLTESTLPFPTEPALATEG